MWRRRFTIMLMPDAQARLRRFQLRGSQVTLALGIAALTVVLALVSPVLVVWGTRLSGNLSTVRGERDELAERAAEVEVTLAELRQRLDRFEQRTEKLATLVGLELPSLRTGGQGHGVGIESLSLENRTDVLRGEADDLSVRSELLDRRLGTVEQAVEAQSGRLAHLPSLLPVRGLIGAGYDWRRDPFTGRRQFHRGLDISAPEGTAVTAPGDGIVVKSEKHRGYGNVLYISHGEGLVTRFGHLSAFKVRAGQKVGRGQVIGLVGSTGRSTAPHLHYEVLVHGKQVDPMSYVMDDGLFY